MLHSPDTIVKLTALVVKTFSTTSSSVNDNNGTGDFKSSFGLLSHQAFHSLHKDLASLHVSIQCDSLTEQPNNSIYDRLHTKKLPPIISGCHPSLPHATLLYNKQIHSLNNTYYTSPYMTYPPATKDMSLTLSSYPKIIRPYRQHLSTMRVRLPK